MSDRLPQPAPRTPRVHLMTRGAAALLITAILSPADAASASPYPQFACVRPHASDGDSFRCANLPDRLRLYGIDAPEMPGSCRPGRACVPGDPWRAQASLQRLLTSGPVQCRGVERDRWGRLIVRCLAGNQDIACTQVRLGHAIPRYGQLRCPA